MNHEIELHAYEVKRLQAVARETIARDKLKVLVDAYKAGELSADDLRMYTNINPDEIDKLHAT